MKLTRHGLIRLCTIPLAAVAALSAKTYMLSNSLTASQRKVTSTYSKAAEDLASSCDSISSTLEKQLYSGSPDMQRALAADLCRDACNAKAALAQLPVSKLHLENTNKFLSQVGNYSVSLTKELKDGREMSDEEYKNILSLYEVSKKLADEMWTLEGEVSGGEISFIETNSMPFEAQPLDISEGFKGVEDGFEGYPKLIYDGPFSDNIMERTPAMTENTMEIGKDYAREKAANALDISAGDLTRTHEVGGKMPAWRFSDDSGNAFCEVTKQGGYVSYFLNMRTVDSEHLDPESARKMAEDFLERLGIKSMESTYFEISSGVMTVNFCFCEDGKRVYPDLVKVSVAMDSGDILGYDARGFLVNHHERKYPEKLCSPEAAQKKVSPRLEVLSQRLTLIPTEGKQEKLCYEFTCKAQSGRHVLVYINAETAEEEQILILLESESGTLTV